MLRVILILIALAFGGLAAWVVVSQRAPELAAVDALAPIPTVEVLVAATDVPPGAALIDGNIRWQDWPSSAVGPSFITRGARPDAPSEMMGKIVRTGFVEGEPVYESRLLGTEAGFLSVMLGTGMRAVAVTVNAQTSAGGFILPNDHVDVMQTYTTTDGGRTGQTSSRILLRNVRVLAIDQMIANQDGESLVGKTATLELLADQVPVLTTAAAMGEILLVLRPLADNADLSLPIDTSSPSAPPVRTIKIYRADGLELMEIEKDTVIPAVSR